MSEYMTIKNPLIVILTIELWCDDIYNKDNLNFSFRVIFRNLDNLKTDERQHPILWGEGNFLYAFFGYKTGAFLDSIERLNIKSPKGKWEIVPTVKKVADIGMIGAGLVKINKNELLFFGGRNSKEDKRTTVSFNFTNNTFTPVIEMLLEELNKT